MMSPEDKVALKMVEQSIKQYDQQYEVAIPWEKHPGNCLLNNYSHAEKRLHHIEHQLSKKPEVCKTETTNQYLTKGYIRQIDTKKEGNFLAHFPIVRTDKDTTKTRIVFDASAKKDGISVNGLIHAGPRIQNNLFDVLIWFRRNTIAVETVLKSTYMDNSMGSMVNEDEAMKLVHQLKKLWRKAGMHARKCLSNSKKVLRETDMKGRANQSKEWMICLY